MSDGWGSKWNGIKRTYRCHIDSEFMRKTESGKKKVWRCDGLITFCCSFSPSTFIWEKDTTHNDYNGYYGYVHPANVWIVDDDWKKMPKEQQESFIAARGRM